MRRIGAAGLRNGLKIESVAVLLIAMLIVPVADRSSLVSELGERLQDIGAALTLDSASADRAAIPADAWDRIQGEIIADRLAISRTETGSHAATNPLNGFAVEFAAGTATVSSLDADSRDLALTAVAIGRGSTPSLLGSAEAIATGNRLEFTRPDITEWYVNRADGLEHGFTVHEPPAGGSSGFVTLEMALGGRLTPQLAERGDAVRFFDGAQPVYRYEGLMVWDAEDTVLPAWMTLDQDARRLFFHVDTTNAEYPITIDPTLVSETVLIRGPYSGGGLGGAQSTAAVDGTTAVLGAPFGEDINGVQGTGSVFIFEKDEGGLDNWGLVKKIVASDGDTGDRFGAAVAISGDTVIVGAPDANVPGRGSIDNDPEGLGIDSGAVYVFERDSGGADNWGQVQKLVGTNPLVGVNTQVSQTRFGNSVDIDGDTLVIGEREGWPDDGTGTGFVLNGGMGYIYDRDGSDPNNWIEVTQIQSPAQLPYELFGTAVSITGDRVAVGLPSDGRYAGSTVLFEHDEGGGDNWGDVATVLPSDTAIGDEFGTSVSVSGTSLAVGADDTKAVYVFDRDFPTSASWGQRVKLPETDLNASVVLHVDTLLVGTFAPGARVYGRNQPTSNAWGAVTTISGGGAVALEGDRAVVGLGVYERNTPTTDDWGPVGTFADPDDPDNNTSFGGDVAISGDTLIVAAVTDEDNGINSGAAYLFQRDIGGPNMWGLLKKFSASDVTAGTRFGGAVAINGNTAVVGAANSAYVFDRDEGGGNNWGEVAKLVSSTGGLEGFGGAVAIDGDTIVVGADSYDLTTSVSHEGAAYIFERNLGGPDNWGERTQILSGDPNDTPLGFNFGESVAISGDLILVGEPNDDDEGLSRAGAAFVFGRDIGGADTWGVIEKLTAADAAVDDGFGTRVDIDGDTAVVGAPFDEIPQDIGSAYIFDRDQGGTDAWGQVIKLAGDIPFFGGSAVNFGWDVAVDGDTIVIGSNKETVFGDDSINRYTQRGAAHLFSRDEGGTGTWGQVSKLVAADGSSGDRFGFSIDIDGTTTVVGTAKFVALDDTGEVHVFDAPPHVLNIDTSPDTGDGTLDEDEVTTLDIASFDITFDQDIADPAGDAGSDDVTNAANYLLISDGPNGVFDTVDCAGGVVGDDDATNPIVAAIYDAPSRTASILANTFLSPGRYRLHVCGSTSILNEAGVPLDGDNDGLGGDDFVRTFVIEDAQAGPNLTVNTTEDELDGTCGVLHCTLREALAAAGDDAEITIPDGVYTTALGPLVVGTGVTLTGGTGSGTVVQAAATRGTAADRVFRVTAPKVVMRNLTIRHGNTAFRGGGINVENAGSTLLLLDSAVVDNNADIGGGVNVKVNASAIVANSTLSGNIVTDRGGGLHLESDATAHLFNATLAGNVADHDSNEVGDGGGFMVQPTASMTVRNSIIGANSDFSSGAGNIHPDCFASAGAPTSEGHNVVSFGNGCTGFVDGVNGDQVGAVGGGSFPLDPGLLDLADNGGPTPTHGLEFDSPAVDAGTPGGCFFDEDFVPGGELELVFDQRGESRDAGSECDAGAFELQSPPPASVVSGVVSGVTHVWQVVSHGGSFVDGVVVAGPASLNGGDPGVVEVRNVTSSSFEVRFREWDYLDGVHGALEDVSFVVVERGVSVLPSGALIEAGTVTGVGSSASPVLFGGSFGAVPVVVSTVASEPGVVMAPRLQAVTPSGFSVLAQDQESGVSPVPVGVNWVAWESGSDDGVADGFAWETASVVTGDTFAAVPFGPYTEACVLADLTTFNGGDPATVRYQNRTGSSVQVQVDEETSFDAEVFHTTETINLLVIDCGGPPPPPASVVSGVVSGVTHVWQVVSHGGSFVDGVVVAGPASLNGGDPGVVEVRNVTSSSFEVRFREWDYLDGVHGALEDVSFVVVERGVSVLPSGALIEAGTVTGVGSSTSPVLFGGSFGAVPVVVSTVASEPGVVMAPRLQAVTPSGFSVLAQDQESGVSPVPVGVNWVAWESGSDDGVADGFAWETASVVTGDTFAAVPFGPYTEACVLADLTTFNGGDPATVRYQNRTGSSVQVQVDEETSFDAEVFHTTETINLLVIDCGGPPPPPASVVSGVVSGVTHVWQVVSHGGSFVDGVVVAGPASLNGGDPGVVEVRNVTSSSFEVRFREWDYLDGVHGALEDVSFVVVERGVSVLPSGALIEAGTVTGVGSSTSPVLFGGSFGAVPVVVSTVASEPGVVMAPRLQAVTPSGFSVLAQDQESGVSPVPVGVNWVAWESGSDDGVADGFAWETASVVTGDTFAAVPFGPYTEACVLADLTTFNGGDPATVRYQNRTGSSVQVQVDEETSLDAEVFHTTETINLLLIDCGPSGD